MEGPPQYYSRQPRSPLGILRPAFPFGKGPTVIQVDPLCVSAITRTWWFLIHTLTGEFSSRSFQVRGDLQGHLATQRQRKGSPEEEGKESQLLVTELRLPDTQAPVSSSQSPGSHGYWLSSPSIWEAGTDIKACLQHPTPATPTPTWLGPRHPEPAHPQCREHPSAVTSPSRERSMRLPAARVLPLRRAGISGQR